MCAKRSFGMAGEWRTASQNSTCKHACNTLSECVCVCLSPVCLCIIERLGAPVCICVQVRRRVYASVHVCVCASIPGCSEPCALVLLNPAVTSSLFPAAAHHRPRPSYVTDTHTHTGLIFSFKVMRFLQPHIVTFTVHTVLSTPDKVDSLSSRVCF